MIFYGWVGVISSAILLASFQSGLLQQSIYRTVILVRMTGCDIAPLMFVAHGLLGYNAKHTEVPTS